MAISTRRAFMSMGATTARSRPLRGSCVSLRAIAVTTRPDLNQVMLELIVEHQAGIPLLMKPLSGNSSDSQAFGQIIRDHIAQLHSTSGTTYGVADSALYSEDHLALLQDTPIKWITRVPATLNEVKAALAQADPEQMVPLKAGYRGQ